MSKSLVAYFSTSGVTKKLAETLAKATGGDLFEIVPEVPYTEADLNWQDPESRSSLEMKDKSSRPEVAQKLEEIGAYDRIYVGFPIWWYTAPTIINTFLEQYDLSGKTVIPFATSGMSQIGKSAEDLRPSAKGAVVLEGKRFSSSASQAELKKWAESLG